MSSEEQLTAEQGFSEGIRDLAASQTDRDAFIALGHTLKWLHSLEEWHRQRLNSKRYFAVRDASVNGRVVGALVYARGFEHHRLARWSSLSDAYSDTYTERYGNLVWIDRAPKPDPSKSGRDGFFDTLVARRPVLDTLKDAQQFLTIEISAIN